MDLNTATGSSDTGDDTSRQKILSCAKTAPKHLFPMPSNSAQPVYKECLKNHAANLGSYSLDGCGEFLMQNPTGTEPYMLTCAACSCHRNFHRKVDPINNSLESSPMLPYHPPLSYPVAASPQKHQTSQEMRQAYRASHAPPYYHRLMELSTAAVLTPETPIEEVSREKKRFRTRFTKEQKDEMFVFAEKQGWKIRRANEDSVEDFCKKIGVTRGVFKVWMHNNKSTFGNKMEPNVAQNKSNLSTTTGGNSNGGSANNENIKGDGSSSSA